MLLTQDHNKDVVITVEMNSSALQCVNVHGVCYLFSTNMIPVPVNTPTYLSYPAVNLLASWGRCLQGCVVTQAFRISANQRVLPTENRRRKTQNVMRLGFNSQRSKRPVTVCVWAYVILTSGC